MPRTIQQFEEMRSERRKAILDAALHVFAEEGYHNASISKVSKHAKISKGLLYNYFESKQELLKILIGSLLDGEIETVKSIMEKPITEESFIRLTHETIEALKRHPKQWKLYFALYGHEEVQEIIKEKYSSEQALFMEKFIEFFKQKGHEDPIQEMQYFNTVFGGLKIAYIMDPENYPIDQMNELIIKQFIKS